MMGHVNRFVELIPRRRQARPCRGAFCRQKPLSGKGIRRSAGGRGRAKSVKPFRDLFPQRQTSSKNGGAPSLRREGVRVDHRSSDVLRRARSRVRPHPRSSIGTRTASLVAAACPNAEKRSCSWTLSCRKPAENKLATVAAPKGDTHALLFRQRPGPGADPIISVVRQRARQAFAATKMGSQDRDDLNHRAFPPHLARMESGLPGIPAHYLRFPAPPPPRAESRLRDAVQDGPTKGFLRPGEALWGTITAKASMRKR